jgi:hypothetical protein
MGAAAYFGGHSAGLMSTACATVEDNSSATERIAATNHIALFFI